MKVVIIIDENFYQRKVLLYTTKRNHLPHGICYNQLQNIEN